MSAVRYRRAVRLAPLLVTAVLAAGCTTAVAGTPSAPPGVLLPPRPKEVRLDGVDPCTLLTAEQRAALGFESEPRTGRSRRPPCYRGDVPICTMRGFTGDASSVGIGVVTTAGIDLWTTGGLDADVDTDDGRRTSPPWSRCRGGSPSTAASTSTSRRAS